MDKLPKRPANYLPLSPITFLERASASFADRTSVIYGQTRFTWRQTHDRCRRLASALRSLSFSKNDVISVLAPNVPALYEMHFGVPMSGAVLNPINTRLDANTIAVILNHSEAKALFVDHQYTRLASDALALLAGAPKPLIILIDDVDSPTRISFGDHEYESLLAAADPSEPTHPVEDEWDPISLNYTSGTTSAPKGVVCSHRAAYLASVALLLQWGVMAFPVYLWTLPMFHCNGWSFTWGVAARAGANVCVRNVNPRVVYEAIHEHRVSHMCAVPVVLNMIIEARPEDRRPVLATVEILTGGAPPPAAVLQKIQKLGFHVSHSYGLTEATGPALMCEWQPEWDSLHADEQARLKARQGTSVLSLAEVDVRNAETMASVPRDGTTMGEIVLRGNGLMKGYYKNEEETGKTFGDGWMKTGDVGVIHPDGYLEIKDRSKDVIISGGENISSVEVEGVLFRHPKVVEAAVVAMPHPRWGESPCAFVVVRGGEAVVEEELIRYCRGRMAGFMIPKRVVLVSELPKTATGKVLKLELRRRARRLTPVDVGSAGGSAVSKL